MSKTIPYKGTLQCLLIEFLDVTDDQVIPSALPYNLSYSMIITGCYPKAKEEHQDEVDVIAEIKNQIKAGGKFPTKRDLHNCSQQTRNYM